jgi:hypothetical protein
MAEFVDKFIEAMVGPLTPKCNVEIREGTHHGYRVRCDRHGTLAFHSFFPQDIKARHLKKGWTPSSGKAAARERRLLQDAKRPNASESTKAAAREIRARRQS